MKTISIPTNDRLDYLKEVVSALLENDTELLKDYTIIFSCEPYQPVIDYLKSLEFPCPVIIHENQERLYCVGNTFNSMKLAFDKGSHFAIYLEDDTLPAKDFLQLAEFYYQLHSYEMPGVMCYTFYGLNNLPDPKALYSIKFFTCYGFCITRGQWEKHFLPVWPSGWDTKELEYMLANDLKTICPEVSRIRNIGRIGGFNMRPDQYDSYKFGQVELNSSYIKTNEFYLKD